MSELILFDKLEITPAIDRWHNTTNLSGDDLKKHRFQAGKTNRIVLDFFKSHSYENYTAFEVWKATGVNNHPITSIRRAMTDLTDMDYLSKLDGENGRPFVQRPGQYKEKSFARQIK